MSETDWLEMLSCQQLLHRLSRELLSQSQKKTLTNSELELLSMLYLHKEDNTPLALSRSTGMKKEAVSRCLRQLFDRDCIQKKPHPRDERSYIITLTEIGRKELRENYGLILTPFYELKRQMGSDFDTLFELMREADQQLDSKESKE